MIWVADLTYIRLKAAFVYLATILDAYSRRCSGWNLSSHIDANLALGALEEALATREVTPGLIHHSDRGVQYASSAYTERLLSVGIQSSMSAKGNVYDHAKAESFFKTLKQEEVYLKQYQTFEEASANIGQFIDEVYNAKRLHMGIDRFADQAQAVELSLGQGILGVGRQCQVRKKIIGCLHYKEEVRPSFSQEVILWTSLASNPYFWTHFGAKSV